VAKVDLDYAVTELEALVGIESPAPNEAPLIDYIEAELGRIGIAARRIPLEPRRDNLLASVGAGPPIICLNTHADTVPPSGPSQARPRREGGRLYGLGACDAKGSLAAMMAALRAAHEGGFPGRLDLLVSLDEEAGGQGVRSVIGAGRPRRGYTCDHAIIGEPSQLQVLTSHAGLVFFEIEAAGKSAHGSSPDLGDNAIEKMVAFVGELRRVTTDWPAHPIIGEPSFNLGVICGGDRANRVPDRCTAAVDVRLVPPATTDDVAERAEALLGDAKWRGVGVRMVKYGGPLDTAADAPSVRALQSAARDIGREAGTASWRAWTEAEVFQSALGIDAVVFGPGSLAEAHTDHEYVEVADVQAAAQIYLGAALELCGVGGAPREDTDERADTAKR
jgi:succinyl-diaminopimelate desuccinylase